MGQLEGVTPEAKDWRKRRVPRRQEMHQWLDEVVRARPRNATWRIERGPYMVSSGVLHARLPQVNQAAIEFFRAGAPAGRANGVRRLGGAGRYRRRVGEVCTCRPPSTTPHLLISSALVQARAVRRVYCPVAAV